MSLAPHLLRTPLRSMLSSAGAGGSSSSRLLASAAAGSSRSPVAFRQQRWSSRSPPPPGPPSSSTLPHAPPSQPAPGAEPPVNNAALSYAPRSSSKKGTEEFVGVFNYKAAGIFVLTGAALFWYFANEKERILELKRQQHAKAVKSGKPLIGGPFKLLDQDGKEFTEQDLRGRWSLLYFGFTNCPDICPEELDKMSDVVDVLDKKYGPIARPIFVSCDPARDSVAAVKKYVADFHPRTIGLTGSWDAVKATCKAYRVYFSTPPTASATDDYLVDHSIYFYLLDPDGAFVDAFGKDHSADNVVEKFEEALLEWKDHQKLAAKLARST